MNRSDRFERVDQSLALDRPGNLMRCDPGTERRPVFSLLTLFGGRGHLNDLKHGRRGIVVVKAEAIFDSLQPSANGVEILERVALYRLVDLALNNSDPA